MPLGHIVNIVGLLIVFKSTFCVSKNVFAPQHLLPPLIIDNN